METNPGPCSDSELDSVFGDNSTARDWFVHLCVVAQRAKMYDQKVTFSAPPREWQRPGMPVDKSPVCLCVSMGSDTLCYLCLLFDISQPEFPSVQFRMGNEDFTEVHDSEVLGLGGFDSDAVIQKLFKFLRLHAKWGGLYSGKDLSELAFSSRIGVQWCVTLFRYLREAELSCALPGPAWIASWADVDHGHSVFVLVSEDQGDGPGIYLRLRFVKREWGLDVFPSVGTLDRTNVKELGSVTVKTDDTNERTDLAQGVVSNVKRYLQRLREEMAGRGGIMTPSIAPDTAGSTSTPRLTPEMEETARRIDQLLDTVIPANVAAVRREFDELMRLAKASS
jgi:hypothetical protein